MTYKQAIEKIEFIVKFHIGSRSDLESQILKVMEKIK